MFRLNLLLASIKVSYWYYQTLKSKRCSYGPFTGEFGHLLGHNLPFIAHLYSKGVEVDFCGMEIYRPFFVNEKGEEIVSSYLPIRDFFKEATPNSNRSQEPLDVQSVSKNFISSSKKKVSPLWNMNFDDYYYTFRWWVLKKNYIKVFDLSKVYKTKDENSVVIFPRKKGASFTKNNGDEWDYKELAKTASKVFEKVYVIGHPAFSIDFEPFDNVSVCLTNDNKIILEKCCNSQLIITQHSGTVYLGEYCHTSVLIIYKGGKVIGDINHTEKFKLGLGNKTDFHFAFSMKDIDTFIRDFATRNNTTKN